MSSNTSNNSSEPLPKIDNSFRNDVVKEVIKSSCTNTKKITDDAVELVSELAKIMVAETVMRASHCNTHSKTIGLDQVEIVLPQIMLDFP